MYAAESRNSSPFNSVNVLVVLMSYFSFTRPVTQEMCSAVFWSWHFCVIVRSFVTMASVLAQHSLRLRELELIFWVCEEDVQQN